MKTINVETHRREEMIDITRQVQKVVEACGPDHGMVFCFVPHTTAGITINENADPDVRRDIIYKLNKEIPQSDGYHHAEGNSDAHLKASLMGFSEQILFENRRLVLGQWQGIYFCEFDGPRRRRLIIEVAGLGKD
ncbi:MAG: secondary thiamine-phosphate synthase enzyme YjbQ [candidate division Zixibacteria bacterium]|nr:secondary thiamine-phosphate synthase enzyme YjbQ [candidate division Zixibacteria bacterium]